MAKLTRAKQEIFGSTGATTEFGVFGSDSEGAAATTKDPALIQSLDTFKRGLYGATASATEPPRIQDINALYYLLSRQIAYGQQAGIPEWDATENYYANASAVIGSDGKVYISKTGTDGSPNINNNPVSDGGTNWRYLWASTDFSPYPLSHLTRAMQINGDGVPTFPDNVAGRAYWQDNWVTTDGWTAQNCTLSVGSGVIKLTSTITSGNISIGGRESVLTSKLWIARVRTNKTLNVKLQYSTPIPSYPGNTVMCLAGQWTNIAVYIGSDAVANSEAIIMIGATSITDTLEVDTIYIGSGLYDTPVYDKACCNRFTNNGVLPVKGLRGQALSFNGAQSLVGDNPVMGTSGTIAFWIKRRTIGTEQYIIGNAIYPSSGVLVLITASNSLKFNIYNGGITSYGTTVLTDVISWHSVVITYNATALVFNIDGVDVETIASPQVPALATAVLTIGSSFNGELSPIEYDTAIWTLAQKQRFYNGDDVVDSQQKSNSGTPHAMAVYGADGGLYAHAGATVLDHSNAFAWDLVIDSDAKLAAWAASGIYEKVLIKKGTWTLASSGVDLTARGTMVVIGEPGSKLVFSSAEKGLYYTTLPISLDYWMKGVTVVCTGTGNGYGFYNCTNLSNCSGTGTRIGTGIGDGYGFYNCTNLSNCSGTGTGTSSGSGFYACTNISNCSGTGTGTTSGSGFSGCKKMQQNHPSGASSTATYVSSYASSTINATYACADTPNGGFNS